MDSLSDFKVRPLSDFKVRPLGDLLSVVSTPAELDMATMRQLLIALLDASSSDAAVVIVDMTATTFCDSTGIQPLLWMSELLPASRGEMRVVCTGQVRSLMSITKDDERLSIFTSVIEALRAQPRYSDALGQAA